MLLISVLFLNPYLMHSGRCLVGVLGSSEIHTFRSASINFIAVPISSPCTFRRDLQTHFTLGHCSLRTSHAYTNPLVFFTMSKAASPCGCLSQQRAGTELELVRSMQWPDLIHLPWTCAIALLWLDAWPKRDYQFIKYYGDDSMFRT